MDQNRHSSGRRHIEIGEDTGFLTVLEIVGRNKAKNILFRCRCRCGVEQVFESPKVRFVKGCSACGHARPHKAQVTHGSTPRGLYSAHKAMMTRCYNPAQRSYRWYGGKGIGVYREWHDFATFRAWALANGWRDGMTLDRLDADADYAPGNCEYVSGSENARRARAQYEFVRKPALFDSVPMEMCW